MLYTLLNTRFWSKWMKEKLWFLYNYFIPDVFYKDLKLRNFKIFSLKKDLHIWLGQSEEEALHYVAEYLLLSVKSLLKTWKKMMQKLYLGFWILRTQKILDQVVDEKESLEVCSKIWVEAIISGGFLSMWKEFYGLIKVIELETRLVLIENFSFNNCG